MIVDMRTAALMTVAEIKHLRATLEEVRELIEGYVDVRDGPQGPLPNDAMRAQQAIDEALNQKTPPG